MELIELSAEDYGGLFDDATSCYGTHEFNELNTEKCENLYYLCVRNKKFRMGVVGGRVDGVFASPFSAPFGGFVFTRDHMHLNCIDEAITMFVDWVRDHGFTKIKIVLPPLIYDETIVSKVTNSLFRAGFIIENVDLNYYLSLDIFDENYTSAIQYSARKNMKKAMSQNLLFIQCQKEDEKMLAYDIIRKNRAERGFPLKMSMVEVMTTSGIIKSDFFLVKDQNKVPVAAAIVFHVTDSIVQVIYWGGLPEYNHLRSINYLAFMLFDFYKVAGKKIVDIGPSSDKSVPNFGLCDFKESLGCQVVPKMSMVRYVGLLIFSHIHEAMTFIDNQLLDMSLILPI